MSALVRMLDDALLAALETHWSKQSAPIAGALAPGLSDEQISATTAPLDLDLPEEARRWWRWHNGVVPEAEGSQAVLLGPGLQYLSLERACALCASQREFSREENESRGVPPDDPDTFWPSAWFPITGHLASDCSTGESEMTPIRVAIASDGPYGVCAPSFGTLVAAWIRALEHEGWLFDRSLGLWDRRYEHLDYADDLNRLV